MEPSSADVAITGMQSNLDEVYPPGGSLTYFRLEAERKALRYRLQYLDSIRANCTTCEHFAHARGFNRCAVFDDVPPDEFRTADGKCESWVHDGVVF